MELLKSILLFAGSLLLFACHTGKPYPEAMSQAIRCMEQHPDSALMYLASTHGREGKAEESDRFILDF